MAQSYDTAAAPTNRLAPSSGPMDRESRSFAKGDVPQSLLDRYLVERDRQGRPKKFFRDQRASDPMFQDRGRSLVASRAYPDTVADMLKVARHRGWTELRVSGETDFRQEVWVQAKTLGLDVKGYRPTERDRAASSTPERDTSVDRPQKSLGPTGKAIPDPATTKIVRHRVELASQLLRASDLGLDAQSRLLARVWERAAPLLDRARTIDPKRNVSQGDRDRRR